MTVAIVLIVAFVLFVLVVFIILLTIIFIVPGLRVDYPTCLSPGLLGDSLFITKLSIVCFLPQKIPRIKEYQTIDLFLCHSVCETDGLAIFVFESRVFISVKG
ncbi:hypothetical protein COL922a_007029 [Colletotrichum nupharicola]|nr:hypothetical protein COL922a_007029 [Colletotrichum nupharicola]